MLVCLILVQHVLMLIMYHSPFCTFFSVVSMYGEKFPCRITSVTAPHRAPLYGDTSSLCCRTTSVVPHWTQLYGVRCSGRTTSSDAPHQEHPSGAKADRSGVKGDGGSRILNSPGHHPASRLGRHRCSACTSSSYFCLLSSIFYASGARRAHRREIMYIAGAFSIV